MAVERENQLGEAAVAAVDAARLRSTSTPKPERGARLRRVQWSDKRHEDDDSKAIPSPAPKLKNVNNEVGDEDMLHDRRQLQVAVAAFLETIEVQAGIVLLILLDILTTVVTMYLRDRDEISRLHAAVSSVATTRKSSKASTSMLDVEAILAASATRSPDGGGVVFRLLDAFSGLTVFIFILELVFLIVTFRRRFLSHLGYTLDAVVVMATVGLEISAQSKGVHLLGLVRMWRIFRLINTLLDRERRDHDATRAALALETTRLERTEREKADAEESLKRELTSRASLERMLQGYKDEVDTLREALNIAARAVAEATMQGFIGSGNDGVDLGDGVEGGNVASPESTDTEQSVNENVVYEEETRSESVDIGDASNVVAEPPMASAGGTGEEEYEVSGTDDDEFADAVMS